jgi:ABC-type branched-subunit amino acid transport system permease subunit
MFFCSMIGIAIALLQGPGRHALLDTTERSAPLFGRELARAKALAPVLSATLATLVYWAAQFLSGFAAPPTFFLLALACVLASTLVALNATVTRGVARVVALACAAATIVGAYILAVYADAYSTKSGDAVGVAAELVVCAIIGFIALRQYGELLANYDSF